MNAIEKQTIETLVLILSMRISSIAPKCLHWGIFEEAFSPRTISFVHGMRPDQKTYRLDADKLYAVLHDKETTWSTLVAWIRKNSKTK